MSSEGTISKRLEGKVAIVTGGASGIGASAAARGGSSPHRAIFLDPPLAAALFHRHGAKVVIADIQDNLGGTLAAAIGPDVAYVHCDVTDEDQVRALVAVAVAKFGRLDIMYSNAGIMTAGRVSSILDSDKAALERTLAVNLVGAFLAAKHAARAMVPAKKGCIIFTASACTEVAGIAEHGYAASKHGIVGLMKSLAAELGLHGIRVNCVSPFSVLTGINGGDDVANKSKFEAVMSEAGNLKGKILKAEDVANAAVFLASDEAGCVSGVNLVVDGGYSVVNPTLSKVVTTMAS